MKFIVLADLHLPDLTGSVKDQVLDWCVEMIRLERPDYLIGAGDMTASGTVPAARRLIEKLRSTGVPFLLTPGNAELRSPEVAAEVAEIQRGIDESTTPFRMIDTSGGWLFYPEQLQDLPSGAILVTHTPEICLPQKDRTLFEEALKDCDLLITGHLHKDETIGKRHIVRGLDPDKAIGGVPALAVFENTSGTWERREIAYSGADPAAWTPEERQEFLDHLGISGMYETLDVLDFATRERVKCFEIRFQAFGQYPFEVLETAVRKWRDAGGTHLSLHLPDIGWRDGAVCGAESLLNAAEQGIAIGCDRMTLHVPGFTAGMAEDTSIYQAVLQKTGEIAEKITAAGVRIGVENMHMTPRQKPDDTRGFGYITSECTRWIHDLQKLVSRPDMIGFHFDIGHARNNAPYSSLEPVSSWLAVMGPLFNGMHLHQIRIQPDGSLENHTPLLQLYEPLISLASLFMAWHTGSIAHAPMFLEIRGGTGPDSLLALRKRIEKK